MEEKIEQVKSIIKEWEETAYSNVIDWKERNFGSAAHWRADYAHKMMSKIKQTLADVNLL